MRFSDVMLSASFVGLAAAEPLPTRPAYHLCSPGHDGVHCIPLDRSPSTTTSWSTTTSTFTAGPVTTTTETIPVPIGTVYIYEPTSAASRRYSVPGLFMLPHRILGLMAGAQRAAADKATKTVEKLSTRWTTQTAHAFYPVTTETRPAATEVVEASPSTSTKTKTVHAFYPVTTEVTPATTEVLMPSPSTSTKTVIGIDFERGTKFVLSPADELSVETVPSTAMIPSAGPVATPLVPVKTETFWGTKTETAWEGIRVPGTIVSPEPTVTSTNIVESTTTTTQSWPYTKTTNVGTVTLTSNSGATRTAQPPKVFSLLGSLLKK
ncbi:hypothetical protein BFW01_g9794 [Lasiodiplodia theobromae]|uniref:uncharacterized protein n=1 Tax=Lasiodiplodia theobromae TaxID=45133 RepID=UPI0015C407AC|nr:uncharacterized protein LTHEOB_2604 [Lasiodiplodia theobromae]KAF4535612.1 hypothetical protein LTHEOB_2604 [Lasiodiplodia theobromae]KAF9638897.1 hypothetical protein BFW01_g9794 [Lasiodiplodia theobromae]